MKDLYHLSHFYEFLCGLYFGGTAILGSIETSLIKRFYKPLKQKQTEVENVRVLSKDYVQVVTSKSIKDLRREDFFISVAYVCFYIADGFFYRVFNFLKSILNHLDLKRESVLLKKFFPSFLFNGILCFLILLLSGFQEANDNKICGAAINYFLINLGLSAIFFQVIALFVIPRLVNIVDYLHIMLITLVLIGILLSLSFIFGYRSYAFQLDYLLVPKYKNTVLFYFIIVGLFPLLAIIVFSCLILLSWEGTTLFYRWANSIFISRVEGVVNKDIQGIRSLNN